MNKNKKLNVMYKGRIVGSMCLVKNYLCAFEYSDEWLTNGFSISPYSLPLRKQVFIPKLDPLDGLFGVFADSLPDGWGRLLVDRMLLKNGVNPRTIANLDRLAIVGNSGMGALTYEPEVALPSTQSGLDLDKLAQECSKILQSESTTDLDTLFYLGGSSGGARPKILTPIDGEEWIIKFPASSDDKNIGKQEYDYSQCAKACGIEKSDTRLFPSQICSGYFGTKRFDRIKTAHGTERVHMITASGLLETSHRIPNLDYDILMKLTLNLTKSFGEVEKLYRLMCFNVYAHNRDDHSKNFTFVYNDEESRWQLSPAYDLTYSYSIGGEHATTIHGNGTNPSLDDLLAVAKNIGMEESPALRIAKTTEEYVHEYLKEYL